ncbi:MAG TPA: hypothetical protein VIZ22_06360 [Candidatus Limnocylindrales bacterium]
MLIVDGPVSADTYDWYEVQVADDGLFGWVAAGKGSEDWIEPAEPRCTDDLQESVLWTRDPIDFLVCFGVEPVNVEVRAPDPGFDGVTGGIPSCSYTGGDVPCAARPRWLFDVIPFSFTAPEAPAEPLFVAATGSMAARLEDVPDLATLTLTLAMDSLEAQDCRVVDDNGRDLISRDEAITRCRLTLVVRDVAWDPATAGEYGPNAMARVEVDNLGVRSRPGLGPESRLLPKTLAAGSTVYIDAGPVSADGIDWYAVLWTDMESLYGWVPSIEVGAPTLTPLETECAPMKDWPAFVNLSFKERLVCYGDQPITISLRVRVTQDLSPDWSFACNWVNNSTVSLATPCVAEPRWLASFSGIVGIRPGEMEVMLAFDPTRLKRGDFPADYTWKVVTGTFAHPASASCRAIDPGTGADLLPPAEAAIYCRSQFVVTKLEPVP